MNQIPPIVSQALRSADGFSNHEPAHVTLRSVVDLRDGSLFAHEASLQELPTDCLNPIAAPGARQAALQPPGDRRSTELILAHWRKLPDQRRMLINMSADTLVDLMRKGAHGWLYQVLESHGVPGDKLLIEITGIGRLWDASVLKDAVKTLRAGGARLALGDDAAGHASFRSWSELEPEYVRIGRRWIAGMASEPRKQAIVRSLCGVAEEFGTELIADGIDADADLQMVMNLGISFGQGGHVAPQMAQGKTVGQRGSHRGDMPNLPVDASLMRRPAALQSFVVIEAPVLSPDTTNDQVAVIFQARPELHALAVFDREEPIAMIPRQQFMNQYARLYFREVHGRRPCIVVANATPCVIERDADIAVLAGVLTSNDQRYLSEGFVVTENGRYVGLGTGDQLVRVVTETRLEAARHANPLTFLPGNIPVSLHIERLLASGVAFVACHADLDNFKPFNDRYGFSRGDEMIRLTARLILSLCDPQRDFVGHLGGDDFMIIFQSADWEARCRSIIEKFREEARALLDEDARTAGGFEAQDRHGVQRFFPCTSISVGAVVADPRSYRRAEEVAIQAAKAKHDAKLAPTGIAVRLARD
jgi:diguanylate cyclase (GGDEF)-like protein